MKTIFITREGYGLPGARIRCYNFAQAVLKHGIDSEILSFSDTLGAKDGAREHEMGFWEKIRYNRMAFQKLKSASGAILYLQRFNYHALGPYLIHLTKRNRIIFDLDDWEMRENPRYYLGFYPSSKAFYFTGKIAKKSIFCVAASRFLEEFLLQFNPAVYYLPSGVDTELFRPHCEHFDQDKIIFSWIGTFHRREYIKNIKFAIECFRILRRKYPHIFLEIVGDGIYSEELKTVVQEESDPNIVLRGWILPDDIPAYLDKIDIGLFPVVERKKFNLAKSPTKLFEYMAMKKPSVASDIGEAAHIIQNGKNGLLAGTREKFVAAMEELVLNPSLRRQLGENARQCVEREYSLKVLGQALAEAIKKHTA